MNLIIDKWTETELRKLNEYLYSLREEKNIERTKRILNTSLMVLGIPTKTLRDIARSISKGNFMSLLDIMSFDYYEDSIIYASLISKIKEFDAVIKYLDKYSNLCECWASCDALKFNISSHERDYLGIIDKYIKSKKPFVRRIGMSILFEFLRNHKYIDKIFYYLDEFYLEDNYYVNVMNAWLLCECFIKEREKTIEYLKENKLNKFTINKAISKCRDSFRVSEEDKNMLLAYRL